jgi:hypothetical protein
MTTRFEVVNLFAIRAGVDQHNRNCPIPATAILLNPVDHALMEHGRLWGLAVLPDPSVKTKRFRITCDRHGPAVDAELVGYGERA